MTFFTTNLQGLLLLKSFGTWKKYRAFRFCHALSFSYYTVLCVVCYDYYHSIRLLKLIFSVSMTHPVIILAGHAWSSFVYCWDCSISDTWNINISKRALHCSWDSGIPLMCKSIINCFGMIWCTQPALCYRGSYIASSTWLKFWPCWPVDHSYPQWIHATQPKAFILQSLEWISLIIWSKLLLGYMQSKMVCLFTSLHGHRWITCTPNCNLACTSHSSYLYLVAHYDVLSLK